MTIRTRAIQFRSPAHPSIVEVDVPDPGPGEVRLRMIATSLCNHSELRSFSGGTGEGYGSRYPMLAGEPGHEGVARVIDLGSGVENLQVGDLVALTGWGGEPAHRGVLLREAAEVARIVPGSRDPAPASILEMFASAYHCIKTVWRDERVENSRVAIIGMGAIGLCTLQLLRLWPAREMVAVDVRQSKLDLASRLGAESMVDAGDADAARRIGSVGIVIECTGHPAGQAIALGLAPPVMVNIVSNRKPHPGSITTLLVPTRICSMLAAMLNDCTIAMTMVR